MQFFLDLILLLCLSIKYSSSNYTRCTSRCSQITVPFLRPLSIPIDCQENNNITDILDVALVCIIDYRIDYDAKQIYINFKASNETINFKQPDQTEFLIQSLWLGLNDEANEPNITHRKYGCRTSDDCGRIFYLNTIEYLITDGLLKLNEIKSNLYNQSSKKRRCKDSSLKGNHSLIRCPDGLCYAYNIDKKQYCTADTRAILFSEIEYYSPKSIENQRELIEYKCNKNFCNGNRMMAIIKDLLLDYTNWNRKKSMKEKSSSSNYRNLSFYLFILSLINLQFVF
jgi:hypothetical protein